MGSSRTAPEASLRACRLCSQRPQCPHPHPGEIPLHPGRATFPFCRGRPRYPPPEQPSLCLERYLRLADPWPRPSNSSEGPLLRPEEMHLNGRAWSCPASLGVQPSCEWDPVLEADGPGRTAKDALLLCSCCAGKPLRVVLCSAAAIVTRSQPARAGGLAGTRQCIITTSATPSHLLIGQSAGRSRWYCTSDTTLTQADEDSFPAPLRLDRLY